MVFIFAAIARQEFHTFFTVSQTSSITPGDDSDFSKKLGAMCHFFDKRGSFFRRSSGLPPCQTNSSKVSNKNSREGKHWPHSFHSHISPSQLQIKSIFLKNFKLLHFVYVVTTLIFRKNQIQCASFSINVAILFLSIKRVTPVPDKFIESQH